MLRSADQLVAGRALATPGGRFVRIMSTVRPKRPTISDIARRAGVSTGAVSYALSGRPGVSPATRQRIVEIADEVGWRPSIAARALTGARAHTVALILARSAHTLGLEPFFMQFIAGLETELSDRRTALLLQLVTDHEAAVAATRLWWAEGRIDGVILTDLWRIDTRLPLLEELGIPAVLVGRPRSDSRSPAVWSDDVAAVTAVVDHLAGLGHRRIARVAGLEVLDHTSARIEGFRSAMAHHGLDGADVVVTDYSSEAGARAARTLLERAEPPTAITLDNDLMAVAALGVARELGITVPEQLSIVAGDDSNLCLLVHPTLTALSRDVARFGAHAARVLLAEIDQEHPGDLQDATPTLTIRGSTGPPASSAARG